MYRLPGLSKIRGLDHGFSTREDGNQGFSCGSREEVIENRARFVAKVRSSFQTYRGAVAMSPMQKGRGGVAIVVPEMSGRGMSWPNSGVLCEGMVTDCEELYLYLPVADCIPIIVYSPIPPRVLALIHAGRESSVGGIVARTLATMTDCFDISVRCLLVGMGPGIRQENYPVSEFPPAAGANSPWRKFAVPTDSGILVDLYGYNRQIFIDAGVPPRRIEDCGIDTFTDANFFSHRRSKATGEPEGRHACVVGMVPIE